MNKPSRSVPSRVLLSEDFPLCSGTDSPSYRVAAHVLRQPVAALDGTSCISVSWNATTNVALTMHAAPFFLESVSLRDPMAMQTNI